jgi:peptidoglycan glycosyltransferase
VTATVPPSSATPRPNVQAIGTRRRTTELGLLVLSSIIVLGAYALASLGRNASLPADILPFLGVILVLVLAAHLAVRRWARCSDALLLPIVALLNGLGFVFIARLDDQLAGLQATWTGVGIAAFILTLVVVRDVRVLQRYRYTFGLVGVALLLLPLLPVFGQNINGARIWVAFGPVSFQPGEFAKIALAIFFAGYLVERREILGVATFRVGPFNTPDPRQFGPVLVAWGISLLVVIFQRDLGSALLFFLLFLVTLWVATGRAVYVVLGFVLFGVGAFVSWTQFSHVQDRVSIWLDPWADPAGSGYQVIQAAYALAWGGTSGVGPGLGIVDRIPFDETDFIVAIIGEELGLLGTTAVLVAFLLLAGSGLRIAKGAGATFGTLLAVGLTSLVAFQAFIIMAGVTRLLPLTGVTLPFVSYGGSSLVSNYVLVALLLRISDQSIRRAPDPLAAL